jgi:hypothetical protein
MDRIVHVCCKIVSGGEFCVSMTFGRTKLLPKVNKRGGDGNNYKISCVISGFRRKSRSDQFSSGISR